MSEVLSDSYQSMAANAICHNALMALLSIQQAVFEYERPSVVFKPRLSQDGDSWLAVFGDNIATGVVGTGKSPAEAMYDFDQQWQKKIS